MTDGKRSIAGVARLGAGAAGFGVSLGYCAWRLARGRRDDLAHDVALVMSRLTLGWGRVIVDVHGEATLTASQPCVYVANHQSYLDYPIMASVFPRDTVVVAKREIRRIPVVGTLFRLAGQTMIERDDAASAHATISELANAIRRDRMSVWMFPEGTRNRVQIGRAHV